MKYTISDEGLDLIKKFEGLRLAAYICPAGHLTIGFGHTADVHGGMRVTEQEANDFLKEDVRGAENCLSAAVQTPLTQHEADACISFIFNFGCARFRGSTLLRLINAGDLDAAADQFKRWNKIEVNGVLEVSPGLVTRRKAEEELFTRSA